MIKAIIFDFDGVIVNSIDPGLFKEFSKRCNTPWEEIKESTLPLWIDAATGNSDEEKWWDALEDKCNIPKHELKTFAYSFYKVNKSVLQVIKKLKNKYVIVLLSNHVPRWFKKIISSYDLEKYFNHVFTSYSEGIYKENTSLYEKVLKKLGIKPQECLFIDNKAENLTSAVNLGIKTILFKHNSLEQELRRYKIL